MFGGSDIKMKKTLLTLLLLSSLSGIGFSQTDNNSIDKLDSQNRKRVLKEIKSSRIFNLSDFQEYEVSYRISKNEESLAILYDFDREGNPDLQAYFRISNVTFTEEKMTFEVDLEAFALTVYRKITDEPKTFYFDTKGEGILDKKESNREYHKYLKKSRREEKPRDILQL
jgi:hypothetical protein